MILGQNPLQAIQGFHIPKVLCSYLISVSRFFFFMILLNHLNTGTLSSTVSCSKKIQDLTVLCVRIRIFLCFFESAICLDLLRGNSIFHLFCQSIFLLYLTNILSSYLTDTLSVWASVYLEFVCGLVYAFIDLSCSYINSSRIESQVGFCWFKEIKKQILLILAAEIDCRYCRNHEKIPSNFTFKSWNCQLRVTLGSEQKCTCLHRHKTKLPKPSVLEERRWG